MERPQKRALLLTLDVLMVPFSMVLTLMVEYGLNVLNAPLDWQSLAITVLLMFGFGGYLSWQIGLPKIKLNTYEQSSILLTLVFAAIITFFGYAIAAFLEGAGQIGFSFFVFWMVFTICSVFARILARELLVYIYTHGKNRERILIYGAGKTGTQLAVALKRDDGVEPVAFVDDNSTFHGMVVAGLTVHSPAKLRALVLEKQIDRIILATPSIGRVEQLRILKRLRHVGCEVRTMPSFVSLLSEGDLISKIEPVNFGALLNRPGRTFDKQRVDNTYRNCCVMITGAGGSIGSELCRQILACEPERLILFEISEIALYQIDRELRETLADLPGDQIVPDIVPVLGSIGDRAAVSRILARYQPEVVFHAAAYKHVPLVEDNVIAALGNNVIGTRIVAECARDAGVARFVLVSTDKAVRPANVMGASKRLAELVVQGMQASPRHTRFAIVRFGNVLGSSGSVIPLFEEQISRGGPVTVTHPEVSRYFMTIHEASHLVLLAGTYADAGEVFVLNMGKPIVIRDLARQMIEARGYSLRDSANPEGDIEIVYTGLRPGEKLHEELLIGSDVVATENDKILRAREERLSELELASALQGIERVIADGDCVEARALMARWVAGFDGSAAQVRLLPVQKLPETYVQTK